MATSPSTPALGNDDQWELLANEDRVLLRTREQPKSAPADGKKMPSAWTILSNAVLHGGKRTVYLNDDDGDRPCVGAIGMRDISAPQLQILNHKVPSSYDGVSPSPQNLLAALMSREQVSRSEIKSEDNEDPFTVGLMTAASMNTLRVSSYSATLPADNDEFLTVVVDAIVTAGISNARAAGANADVFQFEDGSNDKIVSQRGESISSPSPQPPGTINTIILTNACLDEDTALVEAYSVAVEAKCRVMAELGINCGKNPNQIATGTGTDSAVLICSSGRNGHAPLIQLSYSGKHTLLGELIGQAVYQATLQAVTSNLDHTYRRYPKILLSSVGWYRLHQWFRRLLCAIKEGHRPLVPSHPMEPVPWPNGMNIVVGLVGLVLSYVVHRVLEDKIETSPHSWTLPRPYVSILLAVWTADRFLGAIFMPLVIHPVVLVGRLITWLLFWIPESCFDAKHPIRGFFTGCLLFLATIMLSITLASGFIMIFPTILGHFARQMRVQGDEGTCSDGRFVTMAVLPSEMEDFSRWFLQVFLVRGSLSLQLLCSIALQMAHFLERGQLQSARLQLSWLCSRDPSSLRSDELAGATIESMAENLSDSLTSPLFYYVIFGPIGAFAFRVANTLDSRVGYRGRMEWVGKCSARVDDVLNLIPARMTAVALIVTGSVWNLVGGEKYASSLEGIRIGWRDAGRCESPNAGWPMATMAGLLMVRLEKRDCYILNGPPSQSPSSTVANGIDIGRPSPNHTDIRRGFVLTETAGCMLFGVAMVATWFCF
ncbi:CobD/Cbib domain containing protein [Nitzschia inconspicua]|uniref:CobD/Cbib domain containing protein n=1 Tax=Nitzschia inconspicua TaxID=303405 RepID=A0A9K3PX37_9STRA|nr:CobD/Cbib domain containing protein [Nitzschia inconspicua]